MTRTPVVRDFALEAHQAALQHLAACQAAEEIEQAGGTPEDWPDTAGPYCGCDTCCVRETLFAAWPLLLEAARQEVATGGTGGEVATGELR